MTVTDIRNKIVGIDNKMRQTDSRFFIMPVLCILFYKGLFGGFDKG